MWQKLKRQLWNWRGVLIAAPSVAAFVLGLRVIGLLQLLELTTLDQFFLLRSQADVDSRIVIVDITESDVQALRWPISDHTLATILSNIKAQQPTVIGLDLYRDFAIEPGHKELVQIFHTTPNLIGVQKVATAADSAAVKPPPALKEKEQIGSNDLPLDTDGKVRRGVISVDDPDNQDNTLLSFSFYLAMKYLAGQGIEPSLTPDGLVKLGQATFHPLATDSGGYVRSDANGYQVMINYRGATDRFQRITLSDVLNNRIPPQFMTNRIVLIGASAESLKDTFYTPYSSKLFGGGTRMPGVTIHANLVSYFISTALAERPMIHTWSEPAEIFWILAWSFIGGSLIWLQRNARFFTNKSGNGDDSGSFRTISMVVSLLIAAGVLGGSSYMAFLSGWWLPVIPALQALSFSAIGIISYIAISAAEIRKTFGRYLTDEVVANLLETPEGLKLGGERRKVTILMSDLRGFSAFSERLAPEQVVTILNMYLGAMADVITQYNGTIDEFIGDAILVIFGAPTQRPDDAERAVACALAMQLAMEPVNRRNQEMGLPVLEMGIGINTGEVVVGNIGSQKRAKYGIVGSHVNLTGRIESYTVGGQILVSPDTYREIQQVVKVTGQMQVEPKGIKEPITIYEVGGIGGTHNLFLPKAKETFTPLEHPIPLKYTVLEGKHMVGTLFAGTLVKLSPNGGVIQTESPLSPLNNIKINLFMDDSGDSEGDLYAKVLELEEGQTHHVCLRFTAVPPDVAAMFSILLKEVVHQH